MVYKLWCCVKPINKGKLYYDYTTLSSGKNSSITTFTSKFVNEYRQWVYWQKQGWKCIKVNVTITPDK